MSNFKKVNEVFQTKNYEMFKFRNDNRSIRQYHVQELVNKMKEKGWIQGSYAVINEKNEVIDGQHRILAARTIGIPVSFTIERKTSFDTIQDLNQSQVNWSKYDHVHGWVTKQNQNYIILEGFMKRYPEFKITEMMMFLSNSFTSVTKETFESGRFEVRSVRVGEEWINNFRQLKPYFEKGYNKSIFVRSLIKVMSKKKEFSFDQFIHKVSIRPGSIHLCGTVDQYVEMIENIYNFQRKGGKINLRF